MNRNILIAGGSGLLGRHISRKLIQNGDRVAWLTRKQSSADKGIRTFLWNPAKVEIDPAALQWATHIINLAGESIGETHWTKEGKTRILLSRIDSVNTLVSGMKNRTTPLQGFVGVSGIGYYGPGISPNSETDAPGTGFPAEVAKAWEDAYSQITPQLSDKKSVIRLAVVLSVKSGALPKILQPIRLGFGSVLGSGKQFFPWIHVEDAAEAFVQALDWDGAFNVASPEELDNKQLTIQLADVLHRPLLLPAVPAFALKLLLGDRACLVTEGNRASIRKLRDKGFSFAFPRFKNAVEDLISRSL